MKIVIQIAALLVIGIGFTSACFAKKDGVHRVSCSVTNNSPSSVVVKDSNDENIVDMVNGADKPIASIAPNTIGYFTAERGNNNYINAISFYIASGSSGSVTVNYDGSVGVASNMAGGSTDH